MSTPPTPPGPPASGSPKPSGSQSHESIDLRPKLRPLEGFPVEHEKEKLLALRDPSGLSEYTATLPAAAVAVVELCDGEHTRDQICDEFYKRYRQRLPRESLDQLLAQLDAALLLDSEKFRQFSAGVFSEFARSPVRLAHLAGKSYPKDPAELRKALDAFFDPPHGPGRAAVAGANGAGAAATGPAATRPRAIIAPHIDFNRGGPAYAWAYKPLVDAAGNADDRPELVIVLGTDHGGLDHPFTLTRKHYETPLGRCETDVELVNKLAAAIGDSDGEGGGEKGIEGLFSDEYHHRGEHSIEFQMVWLQYVYGSQMSSGAIKVVPILCGSLQEFIDAGENPQKSPRVGGFLEKLAALTAGRKVLWLAGADLAHVGPRFGDPEPLDDNDKQSLEKRDQATLAHVLKGDADGWFGELQKERDRRRVCGLSPIYAMLEAAKPGAGQLKVYAQCPAEEGSVVSIASVVY